MLVGDELFRRGYSRPLLNCINLHQVDYIIRNLHEGICEYHSESSTIIARVLRVYYFWPTIEANCTKYIKKCVPCQKHDNMIHKK